MRMSAKVSTRLEGARKRLASEDGFSMIIALGVLVITSLFAVAAFNAVQADTPLTQHDLESKRAYYAARAGANAFLYQLNQNPEYWETCPNVAKTSLAPTGTSNTTSSTSEAYSYSPIAANGNSSCVASNAIATMIDEDTQTFRMKFIGYSGTAGSLTDPEIQRGLIASFRKATPLDYLWYTIYETLDPSTYPTANAGPGQPYSDCAQWERAGRPDYCSDINWISGDALNGPAYTQDQYLIPSGSTASFGRAGASDSIQSSNPNNPTNPNSICFNNDCGTQTTFNGVKTPNAEVISPPADNTELETDATKFGVVYRGVTTIVLNGATATITNATSCPSGCSINIGRASAGRIPVIYVDDQSGCVSHTYDPYNVTYPSTGACGDVYVSGTYSQSLTIASKGDIIIKGSITKQSTAPVPTLGLVANNFVRVMHGVSARPDQQFQCVNSGNGNGTNTPGQYLQNPTIDAAILAVQHSFIVDNYDCGAALGTLHIHGAIAQIFRGTVGTGGGGGADTGYVKDYNYDDRFAVAQPPYLFDIASSAWHIARETVCIPNGPDPSSAC
jgi:Tfp pilus assembly protein PilX